VILGEKAGDGVFFFGRMGEDGCIENLFGPVGRFKERDHEIHSLSLPPFPP